MLETNKIYQGDALKILKTFPSESINCLMTSPPYWALRDYGSSVESIFDEKEDCNHEWAKGEQAGDQRIEKRSEARAGWERPSREAFLNRDVKNVCPVCYKEFEGKLDQKFCSLECLNTLSNKQMQNTKQLSNFCSKCGAWKGQLGLEPTFDLYIKHLCDIFDEVKRVLRKDGTCWVNLGDTYSATRWTNNTDSGQPMNNFKDGDRGINPKKITGLEDKNLTLVPFRFAIEMQNRGWILRNVIIWHKPNCMPSSVKDRFTVDFEYLFFFVKNKKYWFETQYEKFSNSYLNENRPFGVLRQRLYQNSKYNKFNYRVRDANRKSEQCPQFKASQEEIKKYKEEPIINSQGRNKRCVWHICTRPFAEAHFATYPEQLCETPIKSGCPEFVCDKCGKAREKIIETFYISKNGEIKGRQEKEEVERGEVERIKGQSYGTGKGKDGPWGYTERLDKKEIIKGYSKCSCNYNFSGGIVLDPFFGAGTTGLVALKQNKKFIGIELNPEYIKIAQERLKPYLEQTKLI